MWGKNRPFRPYSKTHHVEEALDMKTWRTFGLVAALSLPVFACGVTPEEELGSESDDLVQFPERVFTAAPRLNYGDTSAPIAYTRALAWGAIRFNATEGDDIVATVAATTADRVARAYLVEKRGTQYVAILSGTQSLDGVVKAKLSASKEYFIVFKDNSRRNASFTVKLEKAGALPAACAGAPLLEPQIVERTPQAQNPGFATTGTFESTVRRCNVATGCADPRVVRNANQSVTVTKSDRWYVSGVAHDGATGELKGAVNVTADDGRTVSVDVTGAATVNCLSYAGRKRVEIDAITYYDVEVKLQATTPAIAPRVVHPDMPDAECDNQELIPDEEVLARFPRGASQVALSNGNAPIQKDTQFCHPQTGCQPWQRQTVGYNLQANASVLGRDTLGISIYSNAWGQWSPVTQLNDGTFTGRGYVLRGSNTAPFEGRISDTHILIKEQPVQEGLTKVRHYSCIPIIPHP
jgi:hypothetical protein